MKAFFKIVSTLVFAGIVIYGCESLLDVTFSTRYDANLDVVIPPQSGQKSTNSGYSFSASATIDPLSDDEIAEYANSIKDFKITKITAEITSVSKPTFVNECTLTTSSPDYPSSSWTFTQQNIQVGTKFTLGNENNEITKAQDILKALKPLNLTLTGTASENDVQFRLKVTIDVDVTASAND